MEKHSSLGNPKCFKTNNILNFSRLTAEIPLFRKNLKKIVIDTYYPVFILILFMIFIVFFELSWKFFNLSISALAIFLVFNTFFYIITIFDLPTQAPAVDFVYFSIYGIIIIIFIAMLQNKNYKSDNDDDDEKGYHLSYLVKIVFILIIFGIFFRLYTYATNLESQF
ncbi:membrane protein [Candidatus Magnetomorum sp. HK-1]|nr:membrane protein [Candidatus Magnetomorum sp. HK-1]